MALDFLLQQVKNAIYNDPNTQYQQGDQHGLIQQVENLFGQHAQNTGGFRSSDQDPYGDPGNPAGRFGDVRSSDEDPYGDPGENQR